MIFEISIIIAFIALLIASIIDLKTTEIPDEISYSLFGIAVLIKIIHLFFTMDLSIITHTITIFTISTLISLLLYKTGQWGGGDVKIMMGLSILFTKLPNNPNFFIDFVTNLIIAGFVYSMIFMAFIVFQNKEKIKIRYNDLIFLSIIVLPSAFIILVSNKITSVLVLLVMFAIIMLRYAKSIENNFQKKHILIPKLIEGDWLCEEVKIGNQIIKPRPEGMSLDQINLLKKYYKKGKIKKVLIKTGIPFLPSFLLSLIFTILFNNLTILFVKFLYQT